MQKKLTVKLKCRCFQKIPHPAFGHLLPKGEEDINKIFATKKDLYAKIVLRLDSRLRGNDNN